MPEPQTLHQLPLADRPNLAATSGITDFDDGCRP